MHAHPTESVNYVFKGRQGTLVAFGKNQLGERAQGRNAKYFLQSVLPVLCVALGRERISERELMFIRQGVIFSFLLF